MICKLPVVVILVRPRFPEPKLLLRRKLLGRDRMILLKGVRAEHGAAVPLIPRIQAFLVVHCMYLRLFLAGKQSGGYGYAAIQHCQREINKKHPFSKFAERVLFARLCEFRRFVFCIYLFC